MDVVHLANEKSEKLSIRCDYKFTLNTITDEVFLACEYIDLFKILVNSEEVSLNKDGSFLNTSIEKINISPYLKKGENIISLSMDYTPNLKIKDISKKSIEIFLILLYNKVSVTKEYVKSPYSESLRLV